MGALGDPLRIPPLNEGNPLKDAHYRVKNYAKNPLARLDIQEIKEQGERFLAIDRDLDAALVLAPGWDKTDRIARITEKWQQECRQLYQWNRLLPAIVGDINQGEMAVLAAIDLVPDDRLSIREIDYKDDVLRDKAETASIGFQGEIMVEKAKILRTASQIGQKLGLPLVITPLPEPRKLTCSSILCDILLLTIKNVGSLIYHHPRIAAPILASGAVVIMIKKYT